MSSEISGGKFPESNSNLAGNLLVTYVNQSRSFALFSLYELS